MKNRALLCVLALTCFSLPAVSELSMVPMRWTENPLPFTLKEKMREFNVQVWSTSASTPNEGDVVYVSSNNILMTCRPLVTSFQTFDGMLDGQLKAYLADVRDFKTQDDMASYNLTGPQAVQKSKEMGYFGTEQHIVCSIIASARTGFRIAPEFFIEADAFGGTAGNGPDIEDEGNAGQKKSTIAMGHDPDWILGRYFDRGPLASLNSLRPTQPYQRKRMGCFGLLNGLTAQTVFGAGFSFGDEAAFNDKIYKELDRLAEADNTYTDFFTLKPNAHGWMTKFRRSFMRGGWDWKEGTYEWDGNPPASATAVNIFAMAPRRNPDYRTFFHRMEYMSNTHHQAEELHYMGVSGRRMIARVVDNTFHVWQAGANDRPVGLTYEKTDVIRFRNWNNALVFARLRGDQFEVAADEEFKSPAAGSLQYCHWDNAHWEAKIR